jgi:hypothetical protein
MLYNYRINKLNPIEMKCLRLAVLGERLATDTTGQLAVEDKVILFQILILCFTSIEAYLRQAVAGHTVLAVCDRRPSATGDLGG